MGTANSNSKRGGDELLLSSCMHKLTLPFLFPNKVPVTLVEEEEACALVVLVVCVEAARLDSGSLERSELEEEDGWKPQQAGTTHSMSDRNDLRNLTSLPQSTEVGL